MQGKITDLKVMWQNEKESFYKGTLEVLRDSGIIDNIPVIVSGNVLKEINIDSSVNVKGQLRSKDTIDNESGRLKVNLFIYVKEIVNTNDDNISSITNYCKNFIELDGYVVKRPNLRTTPSGKQITDLLIACNYGKDKTAYIPCIAWGRNARFVSKLKVGDYIHLQGRFQSRKYTKVVDNISYDKIAYELSIDTIA